MPKVNASRPARLPCAAILFAAVSLAAEQGSRADSVYWQDGAGDWFNSANWIDESNGGVMVPGSLDTVIVDNGLGPTISSGAAFGAAEYAGDNIAGTITQTGGNNTISASNAGLTLGFNPAAVGNYTLSNGNLTVSTSVSGGVSESIGFLGTGKFTQSGGTHTTSYIILGFSTGSSGTYSLSGTGLLNNTGGEELVGYLGTATFNQTGGTNSTSYLYVANGPPANASGAYTLSGNATLSVNSLELVGISNTGTFNQTGGTHTATALDIGEYGGSNGTFSLSAGFLSVMNFENVAYSGTAAFNQSGGFNTTTSLGLALQPGAAGSYSLSGNGSLSVSAENIGVAGSGNFAESGGSNAVASLSLGVASGAVGAYSLSNTASLFVASNEYIGVAGNGTFNQTGGNHTVSGTLTLAANPGSSGTYNLSNGTLTATTIQVNTGGTLVQTGGTLAPTSINLLGGNASFQNVTTKLNALTFTGSANNWSGKLDLANSKLILEPAPATKATALANSQNQVAYGLSHPAGITDSTLPANFGIALLDNAVTNFTTFGGISVDTNSVLISQELLGDANADGHVDLTDLSTLLNHFGQSTPNWTDGNFDNAPTIDLTDLSDVLNNFGQSNPNPNSSSFPLNQPPNPQPSPSCSPRFSSKNAPANSES